MNKYGNKHGKNFGKNLERMEEEVAAAEPRAGRPFRICLTGGPCAGKSSALSALRTRLQKLGLQVWAANRHGRACALARPERLRPEGGRCWRCRSARRRSLRARAAMTRPGSAGRSTSSSDDAVKLVKGSTNRRTTRQGRG